MSEQNQLIKADTVYGLIQSVNDILRERFSSGSHTLSDNVWRTCNALDLESGFWQAIRDRDFGSVLTYSAMLAGRGVNVADLIHSALESYNEQVVKLQTTHSGAIGEAERKIETHNDTIRLQRITIEQHERTIADLRAKLDEKGTPEPYRTELVSGIALESERIPELCYSMETVCGELVETLVIQGDPAAVKDLALAVRAEKTSCDGPRSDANIVFDVRDADGKSALPETAAAAAARIYGKK